MHTVKRVAVLTIALALGASAVAACSSDESGGGASGSASVDVSSKLAGMSRKAEVDPETAVVKFPVDYVELGEQEDSSILYSARDAAVAECAREELGIPWVATEPDGYMPTAHMWQRYGPWTKPVAEKFAFVDPMGDGALIVNGYVEEPDGYELIPWPNEGIPEADRNKVFDTCNSKPEVKRFDDNDLWVVGPGQQALNDEEDAVDQDPRMQALFDELRTCYAENGMELDEELPGYITAYRDTIDEEQIELALKTVECKDQINFTRRAADIIAERQVPVIEEYADELFQNRANWDAAVAEAKEYIASHPELFEPVDK
ncbi:hypothetical protein [Actinobaculum sp. 313]|uniref:hypothetical protein n=1 Tax=Actinobaculum sp. 313 TaxID=2495645 RepID=UPI000D5268DC|nr:hypothetical protein [Actinobaculum sp. 313]AWE43215.1 hypothetical protein DDD63_11200 [Actinobaculum sp. 313]